MFSVLGTPIALESVLNKIMRLILQLENCLDSPQKQSLLCTAVCWKVLNASATVRASMLIVWVIFYLLCEVSYEMVHKNQDILKGVTGSSVYGIKNKEGAVTGSSNLLKITL